MSSNNINLKPDIYARLLNPNVEKMMREFGCSTETEREEFIKNPNKLFETHLGITLTDEEQKEFTDAVKQFRTRMDQLAESKGVNLKSVREAAAAGSPHSCENGIC